MASSGQLTRSTGSRVSRGARWGRGKQTPAVTFQRANGRWAAGSVGRQQVCRALGNEVRHVGELLSVIVSAARDRCKRFLAINALASESIHRGRLSTLIGFSQQMPQSVFQIPVPKI